MSNLPLECIVKVIEWIDSPQDLFNLLTVSKDVFLIAARRLYRDPIKSLVNLDDDNTHKLLRLLLSLSPASGEDIDTIRQSINLPPAGTPLNPQPMIDYLSLVKVIRWRERDFNEYGDSWLSDKLNCGDLDIHPPLTWAFVGHRLDVVEELEIEAEGRELYLNNAARMIHLRKIWVRLDKEYDLMAMYDFAEAMIKAIQRHHGPYQL